MTIGDSFGTFVDAVPLLDAARDELGPGEFVHDERLSLMDLMSAVEIMDARTDSFLAARTRSQLTERPAWSPARDLLPREVVYIMNEILRLEATFLDGHPLGLTLFSCHYFRPAALRALSSGPPNPGRQILRALLLGVIKTAEIVWEELAKGQVYEHEDVHLAMSSLEFAELLGSCYPLGQQSAQERIITVDDALQAMSDAQDQLQGFVSENAEDELVIQQISHHISMRIELVWACALLTSPPHTDPQQVIVRLQSVLEHLNHVQCCQAVPGLEIAFSRDLELPLPSPQPPRELEAFAWHVAQEAMKKLAADLTLGCEMWEQWSGARDWAHVREYHVSLSRQAMVPYARSVHQTIVMTSRSLFGDSQPLALASAFFNRLAGVPVETWDHLVELRNKETTWDAPARKLLGWADKVSHDLVQNLAARCQNRARARRLVVKKLPGTLYLIEELESLRLKWQDAVPGTSIDSMVTALRIHTLSEVLEVLLMGFELELYEHEEWERVWWTAERVASRVEAEIQSAAGHSQSPLQPQKYLHAKLLEARAIKCMCNGSRLMVRRSPRATRMSTPLLHVRDDDARDQDRFHQRFRWLMGSMGAVAPPLDSLADWQEFQDDKEKPPSPAQARSAFSAASENLNELGSIPLIHRGLAIAPESQLRFSAAMRKTALANVNILDSIAKLQDVKPQIELRVARKELAWFPIWQVDDAA